MVFAVTDQQTFDCIFCILGKAVYMRCVTLQKLDFCLPCIEFFFSKGHVYLIAHGINK